MTSEEFFQAYRGFSVLAERLFAGGEDRAGVEMLYGALTQVIIAIGIQRGQRFEEHQHRRHIIRNLATELGDPNISAAFSAAQRLHVHFYLGNRETPKTSADINATQSLIHRLLPLAA